jgi:predicted permease
VLDRLSRGPGIESVALSSGLSLRGGEWNKLVTLGDRALPTARDETPAVGYRLVSHGYFATLGVRRLAGRIFEPHDGPNTRPVAIVNETFARRYWPSDIASAIGKVIWMGPPEELIRSILPPGFRFPRLTVVGVVADERFQSLDVPAQAAVYQLYAQSTEIYVAARTSTLDVAVAGIRAAVREVDPSMPVAEIATATELLRMSAAPRRLSAMLVSGFAALALFLAAIGIYGVASQFVAHRTREMGIRMAIGARSRQVVTLVMREGGFTAAAGIIVGLASAVAASRLLRGVLFEVAPTDVATYGAVAVVLGAVVLAATAIPARRAARIPPADVLRAE